MSLSAVDDTWVDCLEDYKKTLSTMKPWDVSCPSHIDKDNIISSPEMMDVKTDTGFHWRTVGPVSDVFVASSSNAVRDVSSMSIDELVELMDIFMAKESLYLNGSNVLGTFLSFVYLHRMDLLAARNPLLHLYVRSVIRTLTLVVEHVTRAQVCDQEEAIHMVAEIPYEMEVPTERILAELDLATKQAKDPRIRARFAFRFQFIRLLFEVNSATTSKTNASRWFEIAKITLESLHDVIANADVKKELVVDKNLFRHEESSSWLTVLSVVKEAALPALPAAFGTFCDIVTQVHSLAQLLEVNNLAQVTIFLDHFAQKKPVLLTRSLATIFILPENLMSPFLGRQSVLSSFWKMLEHSYGAPLYGLVADNDDAATTSVVNYRLSKLVDVLEPRAQTRVREQIVNSTRQWGAFMTTQYLTLWRSLLFNRGRCHRRLLNLLEMMRTLQSDTLSLENDYFTLNVTGLPKMPIDEERQHMSRAAVLSNFVLEFISQVMLLVVSATVQLQLLAPAEFIAAHWLLSFLQGVRSDNHSKLYTASGPQLQLPPHRPSKKVAPTVNPVFTQRKPTNPPRSLAIQINLCRALADAMWQAAVAMKMKKLISFDLPATSLVSVDTIFNNRFRNFAFFQRPVYLKYSVIERAIDEGVSQLLQGRQAPADADVSAKAAALLTHVTVLTKRIADDAKQVLLSQPELCVYEAEMLQGAERTARAMSATLSMLQALDEESLKKFHVTLEAPYYPSFTTVVLKRK